MIITSTNTNVEVVYDPDAHYVQLLRNVELAKRNVAKWTLVVDSLKMLFDTVSTAIKRDVSKRIDVKWSDDPDVIMNLAALSQFSLATGGCSLWNIVNQIHNCWPKNDAGFDIDIDRLRHFPNVIVSFPATPRRKNDPLILKRKANLAEINAFFAPLRKPFDIAQRALRKATHDLIMTQQCVDNFDSIDGSFTSHLTNDVTSMLEFVVSSQIVSIDRLPNLQWFFWPPDIEILANSKFKSGKQGEGGGESWAACVFGGKIQGQSSLFDLAVPSENGFQRWEVKEYDTSSKEPIIRLGSHGTSATANVLERLFFIFQQLRSFVIAYKNIKSSDVLQRNAFATNFVNSLEEYVPRAYSKMIIHGQITNIDLVNLGKVIRAAKKIFHDVSSSIDVPTMELFFNGDRTQLCGANNLRVLKMLGAHNPALLNDNNKLYAAIAELEDPVFSYEPYKDMLTSVFSALTPQTAFGNVDGLLLVNTQAFIKIPSVSLNSVLKYAHMTENRRPNFKISAILAKPESAIAITTLSKEVHNDSL